MAICKALTTWSGLLPLALALGFSQATSSCSGESKAAGNAPSAEVAEKAVEEAVAKQSGGRIRLASFDKTDGQGGEMLGVPMYALDYAAELEFTDDCRWLVGGQYDGFETDAANSAVGTPMKKGEKAKVVGQVEFAKKESGWTVRDVECERAP